MKPLHELVAKDKQHLPYVTPETFTKAKKERQRDWSW